MDINIDNYESYFLLYADNELNAADRKAVEEFILLNPSLQSELDGLCACMLIPEEMVYSPKMDLLKINAGENLQESLLLKLDDEAGAELNSELTSLISKDASVEKEWNILNACKLDSKELIEFEDKKSLYRYEAPVIRFAYWKRLAAAVIIGAGLFSVSLMVDRNGTDDEVVSDNPVVTAALTPEVKPQQVVASESTEQGDKISGTQEEILPAPEFPGQKNEASYAVNKSKVSKVTEPEIQTNVSPLERNEVAMVPVSLKNKVVNVAPPGEVMEEIKKALAEKPLDADLSIHKNDMASAASSVEEEEESSSSVLFIDGETFNKSKIGGMLKKVKKTIDKKSSIKIPGNLRVGSYKIAIK